MNEYEINKQTLAVISKGKKTSLIIEEDREFTVVLSTMKVIDESCRFFGSSYEGRFNGTKCILGISNKSPIIIEESSGIIFFPTSSPRLDSCSWISLNNIESYYKSDNKTIIKFSCGKEITLNLSYSIIDNQVLRATRLEVLLNRRINNIKNLV